MHRGRLISETSVIESPIKPIATAITRKNPASTITAMSSRREADNQYLRLWVAKTWDRFPPILLVAVAFDLFVSNALAMRNESLTVRAPNDLPLQCSKSSHWLEAHEIAQ